MKRSLFTFSSRSRENHAEIAWPDFFNNKKIPGEKKISYGLCLGLFIWSPSYAEMSSKEILLVFLREVDMSF